MSATYKADFNLWIEQTAQLLRSHRWQEVDVERYEIITLVSLTLYEKSLTTQAFLETCGRAIALL
ncbi:MAG: DUF29 family protein [Nostoc sp.]|uniref:DUF29 family protein n=1 Tax=Nostoc sp. TaxID=1180 RepID=UPI002FF8946F